MLKNKGGITFASVKKALCVCSRYLLAVLPFALMDVFIRILANSIHYAQPTVLLPSILFSVIWIGLFVGITVSLPRLAGRIVYGLLFALFFALFLTNSIYYSYVEFFFSFKLLSLADAGSAYIWDTIKGANPFIYIYCLLVILSAVAAIWFFPAKKSGWRPITILVTCVLFILLHFLTPMLYGEAYDTLKWDAWRNPRNVYNNFNDTNKNVKICGLYEYSFRDFCKSLLANRPQKSTEEVEFLEEALKDTIPHSDNPYTGIFKGKNVIFLQLEGMDTWLLTEEDTPTLYKLQQESINYIQHYSYYTGGGSTFNSELAVNTGFITPITYYQNAYNFTNNLYPYSLPKIFKETGYRVNTFHMNTGEYYSRKLNYLNWGYDNYYGLLDIAHYEGLEYELDRELILNETFYEQMFCQEGPFLHYIITYTPHTPFTNTKGKGQMLAQELYGKENIPEMTEEDVARLYAKETDYMVQLLLEGLEENGLLENTVIVAYADHYLYTLNDKTILEENGKITDNNLINRTPFFIWSQGVTAEDVHKVNSQIDILPTVLNMFGFDLPEQYFIGGDVMCDEYAGYVFFSDYSWFDGTIYVENGEVVAGESTDSTYVVEMSAMISELIRKNDLIQKYDHFREL